MSWYTLSSPKPCREKQARLDKILNEVDVALRDLKRTIHRADTSQTYHFDPVLAEVNDTLNTRWREKNKWK
jgi:hypothetical protein